MQAIRWFRPSSAAPSEAAPAAFERQVLREKLQSIVSQTPQGVVGPAALATISAIVSWNRVARLPLLISLGLLAAALVAWWRFYVAFERSRSGGLDVEALARGTLLRTLAHGACWAVYSLVLFQADSVAYQSVDVAFMYGLVAGAVVVDGPHFGVFVAFALPTLAPVVVRCFAEGNPASLAVGSAGLVGLIHGLFAAGNAARLNDREVRARLENSELVRELGRQSALAEAARREAEAANREKSRFLAAASHDLRQPVHALGLFVEAAHGSSAVQRQEIWQKLGDSVAALRVLFDALLEISRLDAGVIEARSSSVRVGDLLSRLTAEYEPVARAKGLRLRARARELVADTDPVLLERLLRNLLDNAVRYTEHGGVLLACRPRAGRVRIELFDTGAGIDSAHRELIFEPFFQLPSAAEAQRGGVGLGLAICRRLSVVLGTKLELRSRVGRGSCFAIELPPASGPDAAPSVEERESTGAASVLLGVVVVIIEDEFEPRRALELLLRQWGCRVVAAAAASPALEELEREGLEPDLVLADFRLGSSANGVTAVQRLRQRYGPALPAAIVTSDTSPERLREIRDSNLTALHKPVAPRELRRIALRLLESAADRDENLILLAHPKG